MIPSALILRSSDPTALLVWCVIGFGGGIALFVYGFRLLQRRRLILDTPFSKIRSASMGMVEISGLATGPYTIVAPITGRPCYYHRTLVWEWKQKGKNKEWVEVAGECFHVPFFVDDNTGRILVDPRGADLDIHRDFEQQFSDSFFTTKDPVPANVRGFLAHHGVVTNNKIKVEEFCIKPKNALFILGTLTENPGIQVSPTPIADAASISSHSSQPFSLNGFVMTFQTGSPSEQLAVHRDPEKPEIIRLASNPGPIRTTEMSQQQKIAAALAKAGITNPVAWDAAGVTPQSQSSAGVQVISDPDSARSEASTVADSGQGNDFDSHPPVVLMKGKNDTTFLISWRSQREIARSLGWKSTLMIWGGPALAVLSLYVFLSFDHIL